MNEVTLSFQPKKHQVYNKIKIIIKREKTLLYLDSLFRFANVYTFATLMFGKDFDIYWLYEGELQ